MISDQPFSEMISNFGHRPMQIPKHTVVGLSIPSPTHILTLGGSTTGGAEAKEGGGYRKSRMINSAPLKIPDATEDAQEVRNRTDGVILQGYRPRYAR